MKKLILTIAMCLALSTHAEPTEHKDFLTKADLGKGITLNIERMLLKEIDDRHENIIEQLVKALNEQKAHFGDVLQSHMEHLNNFAQKIKETLIDTNIKVFNEMGDHFANLIEAKNELNDKNLDAKHEAFKKYMDTMKKAWDAETQEFIKKERAYLVEQLKKYCNCNNK